MRSRREAFDEVVLAAVRHLEEGWADQLGHIEFGVEETPLVDDGWSGEPVPLASLVRGGRSTPTRLVLFRRPIELRAETRTDLHVLVLTVLVEQVADLLGLSPEDVDPGYEAD